MVKYGDYRDWLSGGAHTTEDPSEGFVWRDPTNHGAGQVKNDYGRYADPLWASKQQTGPQIVPLTPAQDLILQQNPQLVWAKLLGLTAPDSTSHMARWLGNFYDETKARADLASLNQPDLQYQDYFAAEMPKLVERYLNLPGWQQGKNPGVSSAGRYLSL